MKASPSPTTHKSCAGAGRRPRRAVVLKERKKSFIEIFRTTPPKTICPNFYVLIHANGCGYSPQCSYCYLKLSLWHQRDHHVFHNVDKLLTDVRRWIRKDPYETYVLNSGNMSDSLSFEERRPLFKKLVELFREEAEAKGRPHTLLLVTKGGRTECADLLSTKPCANVVVSFSVNNPVVARRYEAGAASMTERFKAAATQKKKGWRVRLRIDPMVDGYDYTKVAEAVKRIAPERVTLGTLRAERGLDRFAEPGVFKGVLPPPPDEKLGRYPFDLRIALYRQAVDVLKSQCELGLCEEPLEAWELLGLNHQDKTCNCNL